MVLSLVFADLKIRSESGAVLVEAAVGTAALILLILGIFAFTLYLRENEVMTEAIAAGAIAAASTPPDTAGNITSDRIITSVSEFLRRANRNPDSFIISVSPQTLSVPGPPYAALQSQTARIKITMKTLPIEVPGLATNHQVCLTTTAMLSAGTTASARSDGGIDECVD